MHIDNRWCGNCHARTKHARPGVNHILHLLVSVFLLGCWLPVWLMLGLFGGGSWRCSTCGAGASTSVARLLAITVGLVMTAGLALLATTMILAKR